MSADLASRLDTHIRFREAHNASSDELALLRALAATLPRSPLGVTLTPRQAELLPLLLDGESLKVCARRLNISPNTAKEHAKAIHRRYNVRSRSELLALFGKIERIQ